MNLGTLLVLAAVGLSVWYLFPRRSKCQSCGFAKHCDHREDR